MLEALAKVLVVEEEDDGDEGDEDERTGYQLLADVGAAAVLNWKRESNRLRVYEICRLEGDRSVGLVIS
jgi:hypothetical protein